MAVPPADVRVNGKVFFANIANGESLNLVVPADTYAVDIVPAGASSPVVLGPLDLTVKGGSLNRVFAVGDPTSSSMRVGMGSRSRERSAWRRYIASPCSTRWRCHRAKPTSWPPSRRS